MFSEPRCCCFLDTGGKVDCRPPSRLLTASKRIRRSTPQQDSETSNVETCDPATVASRSEVDRSDMTVSFFGACTPRSLYSGHMNKIYSEGDRYNSRLNMLPSLDGLPLSTEVKGLSIEVKESGVLCKKAESLSDRNKPRYLGQNPDSASYFVPEMSELAHRRRVGLEDEPDSRPQLMEGWTDDDQVRFLAALRAIGSPLGRHTELGFREWMVAVATKVRSRTVLSCPLHLEANDAC